MSVNINSSLLSDIPKVSVYISTFNRLDRLKRAINSVKNQDYKNIEILICDDASNDETESFMRELSAIDPQIIYLRNDVNKGACAARNLGIFAATGKFITGLDDDDEFTPDRISYLVEHWDDKYSFICCDFVERFVDGKSRAYYNAINDKFFKDYKALLFENFASNQVFTLTHRLREIGGFNIKARRLQDWDTWLRLSYRYGGFVRFPEQKYIMHHDHNIDEMRVSKSYPFSQSLKDLKERNKDIYTGNDGKFMDYIITSVEGKSSLFDSIYWSLIKRQPKYMVKYALQYLPGKKII